MNKFIKEKSIKRVGEVTIKIDEAQDGKEIKYTIEIKNISKTIYFLLNKTLDKLQNKVFDLINLKNGTIEVNTTISKTLKKVMITITHKIDCNYEEITHNREKVFF